MLTLRSGFMPFTLLLQLCEPAAEQTGGPFESDSAGEPADAGTVLDAAAGSGASELDTGALASPSDGGVLSAPPGLYADERCDGLAPGVRPYETRFALWADGADKERFVFIPEGEAIDGSDPDLWTYPVGTRLYKTFSHGELKLETRVMEKISEERGPSAWRFQVFAWLSGQDGVESVSDGRADVLGTGHDIPSLAQCRSCHGAAGQDAVNGFAAIQLNHRHAGVSLATLLEEGSLISPLGRGLLEAARVPGDDCAQAALGYLHANCGNCHGGPTPRASMTLRLSVGQAILEETSTYLSTVGQPLAVWTGRAQPGGEPYELRIAPGAAGASGIIGRMSARGSRDQMPPLGSKLADIEGIAAVSAWIDAL